jgi:hypothetical protein
MSHLSFVMMLILSLQTVLLLLLIILYNVSLKVGHSIGGGKN